MIRSLLLLAAAASCLAAPAMAQRGPAAAPQAESPPIGAPRRTIFFEQRTIIVTVRPPPLTEEEARQMQPTREVRCVRADRIVEATMIDERAVEIKLRSGAPLRLTLGQSCPFLGFYGNFYVSRQADRLCAGRDFLLARSGQRCAIAEIARAPRR